MFAIERQQNIVSLLKMKRSVRVAELSKTFFIGEATIRRDLEKLESLGLLKRTYGGAVLLEGLNSEIPLFVRETAQREEKAAIGAKAAGLVKDGDILILDSSSTTLKMADYLKSKHNITVITNGAKTAVALGEYQDIKVYCTGGYLRENSLSFVGEHARRCIESFHADTAFFSCRSISMEAGLSDANEEEAELRRLMLKASKKVVLLCDSSKFDQVSFCKIGHFDQIRCLVTDRKPSPSWLEFLAAQGVQVIF